MTNLEHLDAALENAKLPERNAPPICLRGDLVAEYEDLQRQLADEEAQTPDSLAGNPRVPELREQLEVLRERMQASTVVFRMRALSPRAWNVLVNAHEARENNGLDAAYGFNLETLAPELIKLCLAPRLDGPRLDRLFGVLSNGQFEQLFLAAHGLTRGRVDIPKSLIVSAADRKPDVTPS